MTQPTPAQIAVATDTLRAEAEVWRSLQDSLAEFARDSPRLQIIEYVDTTLFDEVLGAYNRATNLLITRCLDGSAVAEHIAEVLRAVADTYAEEEAANLHAQLTLY